MKRLILIFILVAVLVGCKSNEESVSSKLENENTQVESNAEDVANSEEIKTSNAELYVMKFASIQQGEHNSKAEIDINDDNTVVLYDFYYDGKAPDVYIAVGDFDDNGEFVKGEIISELIEGVYEGQEYRFTIKEGVNIDNYTAISIYCDRYSEDFASAELININ